MAGELVLSAFLGVAFDRLASPEIVNFFRGGKLKDDLLKKLKIKMLSINAVVNDAEKKQMTDPNVKAWLVEVKDVVYDAEDTFDEIETEASKTKLEAEFETTSSKVRNFLANASVNPFEIKMESRVQGILNNLEYLASQVELLELKKGSGVGYGVGGHSSQRLPSSSLVDESVIYGRDDDKEKITKLLLSDDIESVNHPSVITIVGMGGLGKTTLAQHVYNDERTDDQFDLKTWVCVSEEFDVKRKFLLVLDDVWNENKSNWEVLRTPFSYGAPGSKILVTTRSERVALTMRSAQIHHLKELTEEDCWRIFATHAFGKEDCNANPSLESIGRKIVTKCKGLPLALKALGGLLYTKLSPEEWESILTSDIWSMPNDDNSIIPALILSYHYLPSHLKRCFSYCSLFPKDYEFDMEDLVLLWMAENFLQISDKDKRIEDVGNEYFHDLLSRCFFQQSSSNKTCFVMHDLLNDLAKFVSGEFCFRLEGDDEAQSIATKTRHFSYLRIQFELLKRFDSVYKADRLRTFLPLGLYYQRLYLWMSSKTVQDLLSTNKWLRSLSFSGYMSIRELPDSIGNLKYLRYLNLSRTGIKKLPDSTCQLYNLQTLKLNECKSLEELPLDMYRLINLRHLNFAKTSLHKKPIHLGKLRNLQTLTSFYVSGSNMKELGQLNLRGQLALVELQNVVIPMNAAEANMENKKCLEILELGWSENNEDSLNERAVLEKLKPHKNLKNLTIRNYGGTKLPDWFADGSLSTIVSLELSGCKYCFSLPPLGQLPSLKKLSISGFDAIVAIGSQFFGNNSSSIAQPFGSLEILKFENMAAWEEWCCFEDHIEAAAFPYLQELHIENCPKLKGQLPQHLPCLTELVINGCHQLASSRGSIPDSLLGKILINNPSVERLSIINCPDVELPMYNCYASLKQLYLADSCDSLRSFSLNFFPKLQDLHLEGCKYLETLSNSEEGQEFFTSLNLLDIWTCPKFVSFDKGGFSAPKLQRCFIRDTVNLKSLPEQMHSLLLSLAQLILIDCPLVESFPEGGLPAKLKYLTITGCSKLIASRMDWGLCRLHSLQYFCIGCGDDNVESFPEERLLPTSLSTLNFRACWNLKSINHKGVLCLTSLKNLIIQDCPNLQGLPDEGLPRSLSFLHIMDSCPLVKQRCQKEKGEDWHKIAHIPRVLIDGKIIS
ncbi:Disease resistance protein [Quillaja saponaria]|uniref:Disease resistance protein n=1 Tax=Quillaja saponaria TaxID=32244 RepID=A0AAD7QIX5_QUISA|nr:Disease resistance protein [Quillaja saponaria]